MEKYPYLMDTYLMDLIFQIVWQSSITITTALRTPEWMFLAEI